MTTRQVKLTLPNAVLERADLLAGLQGCSRSDLLAAILAGALAGIDVRPHVRLPVAVLSDHDVLGLTDSMLRPADDKRLSKLLADQREGRLTAAGRVELHMRMESYGDGQLRKATALAEAVRRGLRPPLDSGDDAGPEGPRRRARQGKARRR